MQHIPLAFKRAQALGEFLDGLGTGILLSVFILSGFRGLLFRSVLLGLGLLIGRLIGGDGLDGLAFGRQRLNSGSSLGISLGSLVEVVGNTSSVMHFHLQVVYQPNIHRVSLPRP